MLNFCNAPPPPRNPREAPRRTEHCWSKIEDKREPGGIPVFPFPWIVDLELGYALGSRTIEQQLLTPPPPKCPQTFPWSQTAIWAPC